MSKNYVCPKPECGARDSTRCAYKTSEKTGTVIPSQQDRARRAGCRVMHYTDNKATK